MCEESAPELTLADYRALSEFRFQIRRFLHFSEEQARLHGIEPRQHQLLLAIRGLPDGRKATVSELAGRLLIRHHSAVELIDRLADHGLVKRAHGNPDHREVIVSLTRSGSAVLRKLTETHRQELETLGPMLAVALRSVSRRGRVRKESAA